MPVPSRVTSEIGTILADILRGARTQAIPEVAERVAAPTAAFERAAAKAPPEGQIARGVRIRGEGLPQVGEPGISRAARTTEAALPTDWEEGTRGIKNAFLKAIKSDPELSNDLRELFIDTNFRHGVSNEVAIATVRDKIARYMKRDPRAQGNLFNNYMIAADEVANLKGQQYRYAQDFGDRAASAANEFELNHPGRGGYTLAEWKKYYRAQLDEVLKDPEVQYAAKQYRDLTNHVFNDITSRGMLNPERYRPDYTPLQKIGEMQAAFETMGASTRANEAGMVLPATLRRGEGTGARETNVLKLLADHYTDYLRATSESDMLTTILRDPTLNMTQRALETGRVPEGFGVYVPKPGTVGYGAMSPAAAISNGVTDAIGQEASQYLGGYVLPKALVTKLRNFHPVHPGEASGLYELGQKFARGVTVYNPANLTLNAMSDLPLALLSAEGDVSPLGILRFAFYDPATKTYAPGIRAAYRAARGEPFNMKVGGKFNQTVDVASLARTQGLTGATFAGDVGGVPVPRDLERWGDALDKMSPLAKARQVAKIARGTVEGYPRIAAGLDALQRTGSIEKFGKVGRDITLPYGYGAPDYARSPVYRFLAPFLQFIGLATDRMANLLDYRVGGLGRVAKNAAVMGSIPTIFWAWNNQNDEYKAAENSIRGYERDALHFIVPDPADPSKPHRDRNGKPVIVRTRFWVPNEVAQTFGLGNLPERIERVAEGRDTAKEFAVRTGQGALEATGGQLGLPRTAAEFAFGRSLLTGEEKPRAEIAAGLFPLAKAVMKASEEGGNTGVGGAVLTAGERVTGTSFLGVEKRGDADFFEARRQLYEAMRLRRYYRRQGDRVREAQQERKIEEARERLQRIGRARAQEK